MTLQEMLALIVKLAGTAPRFVSLGEALTVECTHPKACRGKCSLCGVEGETSGRVLRTKWHQGALVFPMVNALHNARVIDYTTSCRWLEEALGWRDPNERIVEKVLEAMKKETTHATK